MTQLQAIICPLCGSKQLHRNTNTLIQHIVCNNCGHVQQLCNVLGSK